jgi:conjugal transfer/type IV secretion protein DotA/TraY
MNVPGLQMIIPSGDYINHMFLMIFGPIWTAIVNSGLNLGSIASANGGVFGPAFMVYNLGVMGITFFYIVRIVLEGVVGTAYHGKWLGEAFHGFFTPMRVIVMLGLIAPVASGFSVAQIVVLWTSGQAIGIGDGVASLMFNSVISNGLVFNANAVPSAMNVAAGILRDEVCMETYDSSANGSSKPIVEQAIPGLGVIGSGHLATYNQGIEFGGASGTNISATACGMIMVSASSQTSEDAQVTALNAMLPTINNVAVQIVNQALGTPTTQTSRSLIGGSTTGIPPNQVAVAAGDYAQSIQTSLASTVDQGTNAADISLWKGDMAQYGFSSLGAFMLDITQIDSSLNLQAAGQPQISNPDVSALPSGYGYTQTSAAANSYIINENPMVGPGPSAMVGGAKVVSAKGSSGWQSWIIGPIANLESNITNGIDSISSSKNNLNPIGALQGLGVTLIVIAMTVLTAEATGLFAAGSATSNVGAKLLGVGGGAKMALGVFKPFMFLITLMPLAFGIVLAYILPAMLYILFEMAVIGFVAAVFVGVLGAPLFAAAHAVPDGEGFVPGSAQAGYKILLSLFAKPSLIVFGFMGAISFFSAGAFLINATFGFVVHSVLHSAGSGETMAGSLLAVLAGVFGIIAFVGIYVATNWKLAEWTFGLVNLVPDNALSWMGLNDISMSEEGVHKEIYGAAYSHANRVGTRSPRPSGGEAQPETKTPVPPNGPSTDPNSGAPRVEINQLPDTEASQR